MKETKVLGTDVVFGGENLYIMERLGYKGTHDQFRIVCKCTSIYDANKKCEEVLGKKNVFVKKYTSETGNKIELMMAEKYTIAICLDGTSGDTYIDANILQKNRLEILNQKVKGKLK